MNDTNIPTTVGWRAYTGIAFIAVGVGLPLNSFADGAAAGIVACGLFFLIRSSIYGN